MLTVDCAEEYATSRDLNERPSDRSLLMPNTDNFQ